MTASVPPWLAQQGPSLLWTNGDDIYGINQAWQPGLSEYYALGPMPHAAV